MQELTITEIASMAGGVLTTASNPELKLHQVTLDSRQVVPGSLFVAVAGAQHDGHQFVEQVVATANCAAMVSLDYAEELPNLIKVADTTLALGQLAANYRKRFSIPVVAITGSNGKTTAKEMLKHICDAYYGEAQVLATQGNLNNHWGVPLTLLQLNNHHKVAIIEMGMNHSGEIAYLTKLAQPTLAAITNVMRAHAGHFNSLGEIARAKGEIFANLTANAVACVDLSNQFSLEWLNNLGEAKVYSYGTNTSNCYLKEINATAARYHTPKGDLVIHLQVLGMHNYFNALTVMAVALNLGCPLKAIKQGLESYQGYKGRLERKTAFNGALIIDDTYNANPDSVAAALAAIQVLPKPYWFIFADLKELGADEVKHHEQIGELANKFGVDKLLTVGELAEHAFSSFNGDKIHFTTNQDIVKYCLLNLPKAATLLIKGSNSMRLSSIAAQLTAEHPTNP